MAEYTDREHYIPLRKSDLVKLLLEDKKLAAAEREPFTQFCKLVSAVWHFEYLETLEKLKDAYAPFDPDTTCQPLREMPKEKRPEAMDKLFENIIGLMEKANFKRLTRKDVEAAIEGGSSDWGINMNVHWDVFERLEVFARSDGKEKRIKRHVLFFWRTIEKEVDTFQRLMIMVKLRPNKRLPTCIDTNDVFIKMFKDIPKVDMEMVLPGTSLQMPWHQMSKMGVSLVGSIGYGIYSLFSKIALAIAAIVQGLTTLAISTAELALLSPFFILFGYGYKQYYAYQVTRTNYSKMLAENLYYQNLDNNAGVVTQILDEAEEQECRETILAYYYLWKYAPPSGWNAQQLDDFIEMELEGKLNMKIDFEVEDAIGKLEKLGIVRKQGENYVPAGIDKALELLDSRWDNYFQYAN